MKILFLILCIFLYAPQDKVPGDISQHRNFSTEEFTQMLEKKLRELGKLGPNRHLSALEVRRCEDMVIAKLLKDRAGQAQ